MMVMIKIIRTNISSTIFIINKITTIILITIITISQAMNTFVAIDLDASMTPIDVKMFLKIGIHRAIEVPNARDENPNT
jgi:hypothetical protein